jgi:imidazole glycerol-phosphate synthase subunit HisH
MIGILNYGMGNLASVRNALEKLMIDCRICTLPEEAEDCASLILPGVGAFGQAMMNLHAHGWVPFLKRTCLEEKRPILGICLGMQLMFTYSHENGWHEGLGFIPGGVEPFAKEGVNLRVPHMGWNNLEIAPSSRLLPQRSLELFSEPPCFYFVHSYYCQPRDNSVVTARCAYGLSFAAIVERENIMACQFHPEKSQNSGVEILRNFASLYSL